MKEKWSLLKDKRRRDQGQKQKLIFDRGKNILSIASRGKAKSVAIDVGGFVDLEVGIRGIPSDSCIFPKELWGNVISQK